MPNMARIPLEMRSEKIIGNSMTRMAMHTAMQRKVYIFARKPGPTSCSSILRGLRERVSLPRGRGRYGFTLGSSLASPTLFFSASAIG